MKSLLTCFAECYDYIVLIIFIMCMYAVFRIRLGWFWPIGNVYNVDAANSIIESISFSYIAASIFYLLTTKLPSFRRKKMLKPIIKDRIEYIGSLIKNVLSEFSKQTMYGADINDVEHTPEILRSKDWDTEVPTIKQYRKISISYFRYANAISTRVKDRVSDVIIRYRDDLTEDQIVALESFCNMSFFSTVNSLSSFPDIRVNDGVESLIKDFVEMQKKYLIIANEF